MPPPRNKPKIRILHHLARCGGTLISRCLGSMNQIALLSEVHPDTMKLIDPVRQAHDWYNLISDAEVKAWKRRKVDFAQVITLVSFKADQKGLTLILRDWTHIDFHGLPYARPTMRQRIVETLEPNFQIIQTATVRHPIDAYLSLMKLDIMKGVPFPLKDYLKGCEQFAQKAVQMGFLRYEDFTHTPDASLKTLCDRLQVAFDPSYVDNWATNDHVTGDTTGTRGGRKEIRPLKRREVDPRTIDAFRAHDSYHRIKNLLGYESD